MPISTVNSAMCIGYEVLLVDCNGIAVTEFNNTPRLYEIFNQSLLAEIVQLDRKNNIRNDNELLFLNLTPNQFICQETFEQICRLPYLDKVVLELTELSCNQDNQHLKDQVTKLKKLGVKLAVDDFGVGHSSIFRLIEFEPEFVKIDRTIFQTNVQGKLKELVMFFHSLTMKVIVEGVETNQQLQQVKDSGADFFQGYLLGKPKVISYRMNKESIPE